MSGKLPHGVLVLDQLGAKNVCQTAKQFDFLQIVGMSWYVQLSLATAGPSTDPSQVQILRTPPRLFDGEVALGQASKADHSKLLSFCQAFG